MTVGFFPYNSTSYRINITNEVNSAGVLSAVDAVIQAMGWTREKVLANITPASSFSATSTFSPITGYVYSALNFDGTTKKYFIIRWDTIKLCFYTSTCENFVDPVITNESWSGAGAFAQYYDLKDSFIFVGASLRHVVIWPYIKSEPGMWTGVFEFERTVPEDTITNNAPCYAWTSSVMIGTPHGRPSTVGRVMFAFPRTQDGLTGAAAAAVYAPVTNRGMYPPYYPSGTVAITVDTNLLHLASYYNMTYGWDTSSSKIYASPITVDATTKYMPFGRAFQLSVTGQIGSHLDTISIPMDAVGGWISASSGTTNSDAVILPMNGGAEIGTIAYGANKMSTPVASSALTSQVSKVIPIGDNVWACNQQGIYYWPMSNGTVLPTLVWTNPIATAAGSVIDMVFDGQRTIYASTYYGLVKIDTETLVATSLTFANTSGSGLTVTTTASAGAITASTIGVAGSGYLNSQTGTLYFSLATSGNYALLSIGVTSGVPAGAITVVYGGTGYTSAGTATATIGMMGSGFLGIDNKYVYATSRQVMLSPTVTMVNRSTFTANAGRHTSATALAFAAAWGTPIPDYAGLCYVASQNGTATSAQTQRMSSFSADTGSLSYDVANLVNTTTASTPVNATSFYIDATSGTIYAIICNLTTGAMHRVSSALVSLASGALTTGVLANCYSHRVEAATDYLGDLLVIPFRGIFFITTRNKSTASFNSRALLSDPQNATPGNPTYLLQGTTTITTNVMGGFVGSLYATGPRVIFSSANTLYYSNGGYTTSGVQGTGSSRLLLRA
ncbi:hypothetical protein UFOVP967_23 [uncultured Caudovirales phage]|uniref:Uncharacterized protein n=1 Tax=uncultured Caudovirales phage TaxID=2100421 RepID=A0A6J5Q945_9CAUD|nr:hypothetical protein UFOVP521_93 [uncultured Caudovirales phage]CAB4167857.1 hypothetical protein UFOVP856_65 [uncultured Caudovirales phage]CAB4174046.1 hypothetical protein UFOVP967_23 [uncultured Caudovirales phage]CAB4180593.1 hypothetical protein UFOVP1036_58 [uncultured Caudovirales phage]CAB4186075.1 hypothetical protein UFOVP1132_9 [uncultured Caudovirales phage]